MPVTEVIDWLQRLPKTSSVGIDEGGLDLYEVTEKGIRADHSLEIGGIPEDIEDYK